MRCQLECVLARLDQTIGWRGRTNTRNVRKSVAVPRSAVSARRPALIEASGVHHRYRNGLEVISDIGFTIAPGEIVALIGRSGC